MDASEIALSAKSTLTEDWTIVLPRRGKKGRTLRKSVIREKQNEEHPWAPVDVETDHERESRLIEKIHNTIQKLEKAEFCSFIFDQMKGPDMLDILNRFLKILGSEKKMKMVIYGIGSIESFEPPRLQLSLAILIKRKFDWIGEIEVFDPIISLTESNILKSLGCTVLSVNEQGRRPAQEPTLFFMPHCEAELYDNLLEANWRVDNLNYLLLFGNSFSAYEQHTSVFKTSEIVNTRKHILAARSFTKEFKVDIPSEDYFRAFQNSSWHFFCPTSDNELHL